MKKKLKIVVFIIVLGLVQDITSDGGRMYGSVVIRYWNFIDVMKFFLERYLIIKTIHYR